MVRQKHFSVGQPNNHEIHISQYVRETGWRRGRKEKRRGRERGWRRGRKEKKREGERMGH